MADVVLSVELTAEINKFLSNFNEAERIAAKTGTTVKDVTSNISKNVASMNSVNLNRFQAAMKSGELSVNKFAYSFDKLPAASAKASAAIGKTTRDFTGLSRVIQDLPFGFIGIQNNLTQLLPAAGALGLGLSVLVSAITFAQTGTDNWTRGLTDNKKALDKAKDSIEDYVEALEDVREVNVRGAMASQQELVDLRTLYAIATDVTASTRKRKEAVDELQNQYPAYFKNIKDENILNGNSKRIYDELTISILATARAEAARGKIAENSKRILTDEERLLDLQKERADILSNRDKEFANRKSDVQYLTRVLLPANREVKRIDQEIFAIAKDRSILNERNLALEKRAIDQAKKGVNVDPSGTAKDVKTISDVIKTLNIDIIQVDNSFQTTFGEKSTKKIQAYQKAIDDLILLGYNPATKAVQDLKDAQQSLFQLGELPFIKNRDSLLTGDIKRNKIGIQGQMNMTPAGQFTPEQIALLKQQEDFNKAFSDLATNGLSSGLAGIGSAIGEAMVSGGNVLEAVGNSLLDGFSSFLSEFGELLIAYGAAAVLKSKLDLAAFIPGAGIVAGLAAIAAGVALVAAAGAVNALGKSSQSDTGTSYTVGNARKFATGGIISGPTLGLMGEYAGASNNPEVVAPLDRLNDLIGDSIQRSLAMSPAMAGFNNASAGLGRIGSMRGMGSPQPIIIAGDYTIKGTDLQVILRRAENKRV